VGQTTMPEDGVDAQMKKQLALILSRWQSNRTSQGERARNHCCAAHRMQPRSASDGSIMDLATCPREFMERHRSGARLLLCRKKFGTKPCRSWVIGRTNVRFAGQGLFREA